MDGRADTIREDVKEIERTRLELADKLQRIERRVQATIHDSKEAVQGVIDHAADTARGVADQTRRAVDPVYHTVQHPWIMAGTAIIAGYLIGTLFDGTRSGDAAMRSPTGSATGPRLREFQHDLRDAVIPEIREELLEIRDTVADAARMFIRKWTREALRTLIEPLETALGGPQRPRGQESLRDTLLR